MPLHISKIHISLLVTVPPELLERHLPSSSEVVGEAITEQVVAAVNKKGLSYFPALEFLQQTGDLDEELIDVTETIAWFACKLVREEVNKKLRGFFSTLSFQSVKCTSFVMPGVRVNELNAWHLLVEHYTPNTVKLDVIASILKKEEHPQGLENWSKQLFRRNLEESFEKFEVINASVI